MNKLRIIPKLEVKNSNLIKGLQYEGLRKVGDQLSMPVNIMKLAQIKSI